MLACFFNTITPKFRGSLTPVAKFRGAVPPYSYASGKMQLKLWIVAASRTNGRSRNSGTDSTAAPAVGSDGKVLVVTKK